MYCKKFYVFVNTETLNKIDGLINEERIYKIVRARNNLLKFYKSTRKNNYSWVILFDTRQCRINCRSNLERLF